MSSGRLNRGLWLIFLICLLLIPQRSFTTSAGDIPVRTKRAYLVPRSRLNLLPSTQRPTALAELNDLVYVEMSESQTLKLAETIHDKTFRCGGFMEVETEFQMGLAPQQILRQSFTQAKLQLAPQEVDFKIRFKNTVKAHIGKAQISRAQQTLNKLVSYSDRHSSSATGSQAVTDLRDELQSYARGKNRNKITFELIATPGRTQSSLVVTIPGTQPKLPGIVLGGHIDTVPTNKPGADDDGSGSATVAEIFRALLDSDLRFRRNIYLAFYAAEEVGLVGSQAVVRSFRDRKIPVRAALQYDMVGFNSPQDNLPIYMIGDNTHAGLTQFVRDLAREYLAISQTGTTLCDYACSDHASWNAAGFPVAYPFEASFANYNDKIHSAEDTPSLIDWDHMANFLKLGLAFSIELAEPTLPSTCFFCRFSN